MTNANPALRRYSRRVRVIAILYLAAIMLAVALVPDDAKPDPLNIALALVPGLAVTGFIWALGRLLVELDDEYLRLLEVRKFIIATGVTLTIASIWGLLELIANVPALPVFWIFPIWCMGFALGALVNKLTLGDAGCA